MAFYSLWILGILICILSIIFLYKQVAALKESFDFQRQFMKMHPGTTKATFDQGWMWLDIVLFFFVLSFASVAMAQPSTASEGFAPEVLCFFGIAIFCASKAIARWKDGRMLFYHQGLVYQNYDIPYATIQSVEPYGANQYELACKKGKFMISKREGDYILSRIDEWKKQKRNKKR